MSFEQLLSDSLTTNHLFLEQNLGKGCCGFVAFISLMFLLYYAIRIMMASTKIDKIKQVETTPLNELKEMTDLLSKSSKYLELKGTVQCTNPAKTPLTHIETPLCEFKVTQYYTTPGGEDDVDHTKVVHRSRQSCAFELTDGKHSVPVEIDSRLKADLDSEFEKEFRQPQAVEGTIISYHNMPSNAYDVSYEYLENYIPIGGDVYFIGNVTYRDNKFILSPGGTYSIVTDKSEKKMVRKELNERAKNIRWLFFTVVIFALGFIGFYGKPEGPAEALRTIAETIMDILSEMD